jgi:hypothetical protein
VQGSATEEQAVPIRRAKKRIINNMSAEMMQNITQHKIGIAEALSTKNFE